jgi:hypothetical protein
MYVGFPLSASFHRCSIFISLSSTLKNVAVDSVCKYLKLKRGRRAGLQPATTGDLTFNWNSAIIG